MQTRNQLLKVRLQAQSERFPCGLSCTYPELLSSYVKTEKRLQEDFHPQGRCKSLHERLDNIGIFQRSLFMSQIF
ncbi:MAG: hypothetical protein COZ11_14680, partial [Deltaproteobacteria bacterium CG_4_10_14_3_um_filter_51_14]